MKTIWLTGLPSAGKTAIAYGLRSKLLENGIVAAVLDGDEIRQSVSSDLGFSLADRETQIRRVVGIANLLNRQNIPAIVALVSPSRSARAIARNDIQNFAEVFVDCPLEICMERDPKGHYRKALSGEIVNFTGLGSDYEAPLTPQLTLRTDLTSLDECVLMLTSYFIEGSR